MPGAALQQRSQVGRDVLAHEAGAAMVRAPERQGPVVPAVQAAHTRIRIEHQAQQLGAVFADVGPVFVAQQSGRAHDQPGSVGLDVQAGGLQAVVQVTGAHQKRSASASVTLGSSARGWCAPLILAGFRAEGANPEAV
ncbi:MAG: hypothetical protein KGJ24_12825, partial [Burkholderiales bacterium]|nr:hypothetical protein [Burkholderiales bacterium]